VHTLQKSTVGPFPLLVTPKGIDPKVEAAKARRRLRPVTIVYSTLFLVVATLSFGSRHRAVAFGFFVLGLVVYTPVEYFIHRYLLHGVFPDGDGPIARVLHRLFDASHADHHARPWDGMYMNGHLDTLWGAMVLVPLSFLAPYYTLPLFIATMFACYLFEEWLHYAMHFKHYKNRYFQYVRTHHLHHHSRSGAGLAYGMTSGIWDVILGTRDRQPERQMSPASGH
jgi:sterol desaturase/sphingolipid hydroxylase (fatty acid hydroxylase superfamily)